MQGEAWVITAGSLVLFSSASQSLQLWEAALLQFFTDAAAGSTASLARAPVGRGQVCPHSPCSPSQATCAAWQQPLPVFQPS